ncbi:MAG: YbaK/EbsC family protein [Alphaproteobacteria bacterium]|nr:YbaK/EbsC family protein [Alphaproteobacteria bacterium]
MSPLDNASVRRVQAALAAAGSPAEIVALAETARSAADAAKALGVELGAIVKSLVFAKGHAGAVIALVAGDRRCDLTALAKGLGLEETPRRADAELVRATTGYAIGGVAPLGYPAPLPVAIDPSLGRFARLWAAAGHPHCVFPTDLAELVRITSAVAVAELGQA